MANKWKTIAIIFIVLFSLLLIFNIWSVNLVLNEEEQTNICYYDVCENYPEAWYEDGVCTCYNYDDNYELEVTKTKYIK